MKKITAVLTLALIALLQFSANSQNILSDDFESYTAGNLLAKTSDLWTTWSGGIDAEDGYVSDDHASSGSNSVNVQGYNGPTDLVLPFPEDYTTGVYELSMKMYIVSGNGGYFNIQESSTPGVGWMFELFFDAAGGGYLNAGGYYGVGGVSYTPDAWNNIKVRADLDNDYGALYINSVFVYSWQWSIGLFTDGDAKKLGGIDVFAYSADGSNANYYVDDVSLDKVAAGCNVPYGEFLSLISNHSARVNWTAVTDAGKYRIRYRKTGTDTWKNFTSNTNMKKLTSLAASTEYDWQVQSDCSGEGLAYSDWSATSNFTTLALRLTDESIAVSSLMIYPNPAQSVTTIEYSLTHSSRVTIKVYDISGKEVKTVLNDELQKGSYTTQLNTSELAKGLYQVIMVKDDGVENTKLVVQ